MPGTVCAHSPEKIVNVSANTGAAGEGGSVFFFFFFFRTLPEFFAQCLKCLEPFRTKYPKKIMLLAQQYACGSSMLINLTKVL